MQKFLQTLSSTLKTARADKHLTQKQLAEQLDISTRHLMSIENAQRIPSCALLFRIIRELGLSADALFYPELAYRQTSLSKLRTLLHQHDQKEIDIIISTIQTLLETKKLGGESDVTLHT